MNLVWLRDSERKIAIAARGWRSEPAPGSLSFYAPQFYRHDSQEPWLVGEPVEWPKAAPRPFPPVVRHDLPDAHMFHDIHAEILSGIREKRFSKVVPYVAEELEFSAPVRWEMCPSALENPGPQFAFGFQYGNEGICGVTPELLFRVSGGVLHTMALAGTGPLGGPSLLEDTKERLEHEIVVEHIVEALEGLGEVEPGLTREREYPHLKHLHTGIQVRLNAAPDFLDLVTRLHPTGALGGHPRAAALDFLRVRGGERGRFGAPFGFVNGSEMMCVVAIRCLQWSGSRARILSGCGVVEGSVADREWRELQLKRRSAARQLGIDL